MQEMYDVIVVGAGHAGCEAAAAAANLGSKTLLITMDMTKFAQMSCNPAIGGIAKGQIVREIDALGGYTALVTDKTMIQFRMLNVSKGPAMWSPRAQCDRMLFSIEWRNYLENIKNLDFWQDTATELIFDDNTVTGVKTQLGMCFFTKALILTNGTFLNGLMHVGRSQAIGGRISEPSSFFLSEQLRQKGFTVGRMKTGTPARIDGRSINFDKLIEQKGDENPRTFSFLPDSKMQFKQRSCYIAHSSLSVHDVLRTGFDDSPLFNGTIKSIGPRYCPSIEDKIVTFSDKDRHQLFLEPEGVTTEEYYINGFSSSLPLDVQYEALRKIEGLENVKIFRPGYAIEYDYFDPTQLNHSLETKLINNLFFAGQINGTTGYEEAAAQGLMAGINAHLKINNLPPFVLLRDEAYIGVLIDDLVTKGVNEPYRMFTSRAEHRILLRQSNADFRLTAKSYKIGLADSKRFEMLQLKQTMLDKAIEILNSTKLTPLKINEFLVSKNSSEIRQSTTAASLLLRPQLNISDFLQFSQPLFDLQNENPKIAFEVFEEVEIIVKYLGYIEREKLLAEKMKRLEYVEIPENFDYSKLSSITIEARQKLNKIRPKNIGQALRISGISPSDINVLLVYIGR